ncbi:tyrosine-type recombinase/integrase [Streptomyces tricolor]|uniref:Tyrosine-type recombinase/integrase n=1 Tax=Streptomyces tricolor TaxID=68277 RepID=A0ABS9JEF5_9ACTN|nr:tyrosine-type recombinase/integrase [Streptomyces tricolor]MCG0063882.1 tyrosine-type recombinase/integrase [Streptomyces tricolor]
MGFSRAFDRLVKQAGVRRITVRLARHTCGTLLAFLKVHPKVAQAVLRHSHISMTTDVYTSLWKIHSSADVSHGCQRPPAGIDWGSLCWWG